MELINVPRSLIYKDRESLKDYEVKTPNTINSHFYKHLKQMFACVEGAPDLILRCFNNAYYICTHIQIDDYPELHMADYEKKLLNNDLPFSEDVCEASMGMVSDLLRVYEANWNNNYSDIRESIYRRFTNYHWTNKQAKKSFFLILNSCSLNYYLPQNIFAPRDIIETIEDVRIDTLAIGIEYVCEKLNQLSDPQKQEYGSSLALKRLEKELNEYFDENGYHPETKSFDPDMEECFRYDYDAREYFFNTTDTLMKAISYIKEYQFTPKKVTDEQAHLSEDNQDVTNNTSLLDEVKSENAHLKKVQAQLIIENKKLKALLQELKQPLETLPASQKVRMELALQLLKAAGLTDDILNIKNNKQKAARIMSVLLDIHSKNARGNEAQTCATYISAAEHLPERYLPMIEEINKLMSELGIKVKLNLKSKVQKVSSNPLKKLVATPKKVSRTPQKS